MRLLSSISEDEMIALFVRAELDSGRYGEKSRSFLARDGHELDVLHQPDLDQEHLVRAPQPELIAVTTPAFSPLVLVEGHVRLTASALFPDALPQEVEILLGLSGEMTSWSLF